MASKARYRRASVTVTLMFSSAPSTARAPSLLVVPRSLLHVAAVAVQVGAVAARAIGGSAHGSSAVEEKRRYAGE